ncbi:hypothetical protein [uncultured Chryseobacterium sp.]|uniref:hypothetical protein n=1 Tax=uncultured Chryseobacterium sp. TaxID=259322 RepID=UPI002582E255|nr:hypothetical protein [uncultured Chryseobacterium sp.]
MKQIVGKLLITVFAILTAIVIYFFIYYSNNQDVNDVKVEGYVFGSNDEPLKNVRVTIVNERYENDNGLKNYDEYLGQDKIELITDSTGYYSTLLKKSAYVYILLQKDGYKPIEEKGKQAKKSLFFKTKMH